MSFAIAIIGLGFLVLVHELGHFVASLALGMRPRKFYLGFPPAIAKTTRRGIEYGIGAIPLGGFVKIPGMHRPAPADVDAQIGRAVIEAPELAGPADRLRRLLALDDHEGAREATATISALVADSRLGEAARRSAEKGLTELEDALGPDAYWRAATWRRVVVIAAGPFANILLTIVLLIALFMTSRRQGDDDRGRGRVRVGCGARGPPRRRPDRRDQRGGCDAARDSAADRRLRREAADGDGGARRGTRHDRAGQPARERPAASTASALPFAVQGLSVPQAAVDAFRVTGEVTREIARHDRPARDRAWAE